VSAVEAPVRLGIDLGGNTCFEDECVAFAHNLHLQMSSGKYDLCATMTLPRTREAWEAEHRTARKRAWRAESLGYFAKPLQREKWGSDIVDINLSRDYRQGRPMDAGYASPDTSPLSDYPCELHAIRGYGVWTLERWSEDHAVERLVAYLFMYRAGDLALVSQVLGHADHEPNGVMYLLFRHALEAEGAIAPGVCVYNRWDSGTDGLRFLKARIGFEETAVEWLP
jgi:hypothetical protein